MLKHIVSRKYLQKDQCQGWGQTQGHSHIFWLLESKTLYISAERGGCAISHMIPHSPNICFFAIVCLNYKKKYKNIFSCNTEVGQTPPAWQLFNSINFPPPSKCYHCCDTQLSSSSEIFYNIFYFIWGVNLWFKWKRNNYKTNHLDLARNFTYS